VSLWVVVGGQYGSEGKGKISASITLQEEIDICIRCGGPNSGHSFVAPDGTTKVLRQLPTGYIRPKTRLLIPAGALIDLQVLKHELDTFRLDADRVGIDGNTMVIEESDRENEARLKLQERLSSTPSLGDLFRARSVWGKRFGTGAISRFFLNLGRKRQRSFLHPIRLPLLPLFRATRRKMSINSEGRAFSKKASVRSVS